MRVSAASPPNATDDGGNVLICFQVATRHRLRDLICSFIPPSISSSFRRHGNNRGPTSLASLTNNFPAAESVRLFYYFGSSSLPPFPHPDKETPQVSAEEWIDRLRSPPIASSNEDNFLSLFSLFPPENLRLPSNSLPASSLKSLL